jgi:pyruvate/2-oxoglutarate dehydrogenase complex dihydrolipoamide acyltransferase (E2) component
LEGLSARVEEATVLNWLFEEGDTVKEGDELVEVQSSEGNLTILANSAGVLAEVYYDEGEIVARGEVLCTIDDEESEMDDPGRDDE